MDLGKAELVFTVDGNANPCSYYEKHCGKAPKSLKMKNLCHCYKTHCRKTSKSLKMKIYCVRTHAHAHTGVGEGESLIFANSNSFMDLLVLPVIGLWFIGFSLIWELWSFWYFRKYVILLYSSIPSHTALPYLICTFLLVTLFPYIYYHFFLFCVVYFINISYPFLLH